MRLKKNVIFVSPPPNEENSENHAIFSRGLDSYKTSRPAKATTRLYRSYTLQCIVQIIFK